MTKKRKKKAFITTTYREPKWMVKGRRLVKTVKRQGMNLLAVIGLIAVAVVLVQTIVR